MWTACNSGDAAAPLIPESSDRPAVAAAELRVTRALGADTLRPGAAVVLEGTGFAAAVEHHVVRLAGVTLAVTSASETRLHVRLPSAEHFPCVATGAHQLEITRGTSTVRHAVVLSVARRLTLAVGESRNLLDAADARCAELSAPAGAGARYALSIINTNGTIGASEAVLVSAARSPFVAAAATATVSASHALAANAWSSAPAETLDGDGDAHGAHLAREGARLRRAGSARAQWVAQAQAASQLGIAATRAPIATGQRVQVQAMFASCAVGTTVTARVVHVGSRSVVLEDIASPRAGTMDAALRAIGQEFDAVQYPLLREQVGDPLALDAAMGGDGRVTMLFSPYVNDTARGVSGYVTACNLYPRSTYAHSNEDELFYARIPHATESVDAWMRLMRSTVIHEAKHLASFAERLARDVAFEEPWLEEATARIAEELYARTFTEHRSGGHNLGWTESVACELTQCDGRPIVMWKHFPVLHDYFRGIDTLTPLGRASGNDITWYASGWSLVRWVLDHFAASEATTLRELVRGTSGTGVAALSAVSGRPADEMLADWSLANLVDDRPGFTPHRATLTFPSWHLPSMMAGLASVHGARYRADPLQPRQLGGVQEILVPQLRAFAASYFEASPAAGGSQLVELRGGVGAVRMAVVRVE